MIEIDDGATSQKQGNTSGANDVDIWLNQPGI